MKLYDLELSGNGYRVRLLLSVLGLKHEVVTVNLMKGENREPWFLKLNPRGQVPTLDDGGTVVWDSMAILVYLARKYGGEKWLPIDPQGRTWPRSMPWLAGSSENRDPLWPRPRRRVICKFERPGNLEEASATRRRKGLDVLEQRLAAHQWLALDHVTISGRRLLPVMSAPRGPRAPRSTARSLRQRAQHGSSASRPCRALSACRNLTLRRIASSDRGCAKTRLRSVFGSIKTPPDLK